MSSPEMTAPAMNDIERLFYSSPHLICQKWSNYFGVYQRYFHRFVGTPVRIVEIGVSHLRREPGSGRPEHYRPPRTCARLIFGRCEWPRFCGGRHVPA